MPETPERLADRLESEGQKTVAFFRSLSSEQLEQTLYTDGSRWKVGQLAAHVLSTELAFTFLIEDILAGGNGAPEGFDIDVYNERKVVELRSADLEALLAGFEQARQSNVELVRRMPANDLQKTGRHPFLGVTTLEDIIKLLYRHIQIHQRDVRRQVGEANAG